MRVSIEAPNLAPGYSSGELYLSGDPAQMQEFSVSAVFTSSGEQTKESTMFVLTRRVGETIMIGDDVSLTILSVHGGQIRIGIDAPQHVAVHREEIFKRIQCGDWTPEKPPATSTASVLGRRSANR